LGRQNAAVSGQVKRFTCPSLLRHGRA
jgi:hypothetical protein